MFLVAKISYYIERPNLLVNKEDPESIKNAITFLMNNKNLCQKFGENVRKPYRKKLYKRYS